MTWYRKESLSQESFSLRSVPRMCVITQACPLNENLISFSFFLFLSYSLSLYLSHSVFISLHRTLHFCIAWKSEKKNTAETITRLFLLKGRITVFGTWEIMKQRKGIGKNDTTAQFDKPQNVTPRGRLDAELSTTPNILFRWARSLEELPSGNGEISTRPQIWQEGSIPPTHAWGLGVLSDAGDFSRVPLSRLLPRGNEFLITSLFIRISQIITSVGRRSSNEYV